MAPKKKKGQEEEPPKPEELLPRGYSIGCTVFWGECPEKLEAEGNTVVRTGCEGRLVAVPDMVEFEKEDGEKGYALEVVEVAFNGQPVPDKVPLKSLLLKAPPRETMWNLAPYLCRKHVRVFLLDAPVSKPKPSRGRRSPSPTRAARQRSLSPSSRSPDSPQDKEKSSSPFLDGLLSLEAFPHRTDKVEHLLKPELVTFLNSTDFHYSSNSLGNHAEQGWIDWRAIYPWVEAVLQEANTQGGLSPMLQLNGDIYETLIRKFDKRAGRFISNCPSTENILPFGKFVVARLYLELQEDIRKRLEMEAQMKELVKKESEQDGNPRIAALWDTEDDLDLHVRLPEDFGEINFREQCPDDAGINAESAEVEETQPTTMRPMANICWADFDPQATGPDAKLCPPVGQYNVWLRMSGRRSKRPCHWACQVLVAGEPQVLCGTWHDGDNEFIQIATVIFPDPTSV